MLTLKDSYWDNISREMDVYFFDLFFKDIYELFPDKELRNDRPTLLIDAIKKGTVFYQNGEFSGSFNARLSKELSKFAVFDAKKKIWRGLPPPEISSISSQILAKNKDLNRKIEESISKIPSRLKDELDRLEFSIDETLLKINKDIEEDYASIGILPEIPERMSKRLLEDYTTNQRLNIKNWSFDQVERLRRIIEEDAKNGYNKTKMIELIKHEWNVSHNKAKFLARQETSLFLSTFRRERFLDAGVKRYRWSTSGVSEERVRPLHKKLHGKVFFFGHPPISGTRGERQEPGEPFGCRCVAIPLLD